MSKFESSAVTWFEIPVTDIVRARGFYENILTTKLIPHESSFLFPIKDGGVGGSIIGGTEKKPVTDGTLVFLNADGKLTNSVERAQILGSKVVVPRTEIPGGRGFFAVITDSEGNHIGLHSSSGN